MLPKSLLGAFGARGHVGLPNFAHIFLMGAIFQPKIDPHNLADFMSKQKLNLGGVFCWAYNEQDFVDRV